MVSRPRKRELNVTARLVRKTYRPGETAAMQLAVAAPKNGTVSNHLLASALGVVVWDSAIEERAKIETDLYGDFGFDKSVSDFLYGGSQVAGVTRRTLEQIDLTKPVPQGLELVAELLLQQDNSYYSSSHRINSFASNENRSEAKKVFAEALSKRLKALNNALDAHARESAARYKTAHHHPTDEAMLREILQRRGVQFDDLKDVWDTRFRARFKVEREMDVLYIESAGADKRFETADDFTAWRREWLYFPPVGVRINDAIKNYTKRTGLFIKDDLTLRRELARAGINRDELIDRWGVGYRFQFETEGSFYRINIISANANRRFGHASYDATEDDFTVWTVKQDYFRDVRAKIDRALAAYAKTNKFPTNEAELRAALRASGLKFEGLRDGWQRVLYDNFKVQARRSDRVKIEARGRFPDKPETVAIVTPVTQQVRVVTLRSSGRDGVCGTSDDFTLAEFSFVEREQAVGEAKAREANKVVSLAAGTGSVRGVVRDPQGAVIAGAKITATNEASGSLHEATTSDEGEYEISSLPVGIYTIRAEAQAFKSAQVNAVPVIDANIITFDFDLEVGGTSETVEVTASADLRLETSVSQMSSLRQRISGGVMNSLEIDGKDGAGGGGGVGNRKTKLEAEGKSKASAAAQLSTPRLRREFPETLLWLPEVVTDDAGLARIEIPLADNITTWRVSVIGSNREGQMGTASTEVLAFQPFFAEHDPPRILTVGDEINLPVVIRNYLAQTQSVKAEMQVADWFTLLSPAAQQASVKPGDNTRAMFNFKADKAITDGKQQISVTGADSEDARDAVEKPVSVHPDGEQTFRTASDVFKNETVLQLDVPNDTIADSINAEIKIYPNLNAHIVEAIEAIMRRPTGCAEQVISSGYPSLLILKSNTRDAALRLKALRYTRLAYEKLLSYKHSDGGFTYFGHGAPDIALTAYAIRFLTHAEKFVAVDEDVIPDAREWLIKQQRAEGFWSPYDTEKTSSGYARGLAANTTAYVARVIAETTKPETSRAASDDAAQEKLSQARAALRKSLVWLEAQNRTGEPFMLASYTLARLKFNDDDSDGVAIRAAIDKLKAQARRTSDGASYWAIETNTPFYGWGAAGQIETTALVVQALSEFENRNSKTESKSEDKTLAKSSDNSTHEASALLRGGLLFLMRNKDETGCWYSTQTTVNVLDTLVTLLANEPANENRKVSDTLEILVDAAVVSKLDVPYSHEPLAPLSVNLTRFIKPGSNQIVLRRATPGGFASAQLVSDFYVAWKPDAKQAERNTRVTSHGQREFEGLNSSSALGLKVSFDKQAAKAGDEISCAVAVERIGFRGYGMMLGEIGLPPASDVDRASLEEAIAESGYALARYDVLPDRLVIYVYPQAGGTKFNFKFRPRYAMNAQTSQSQLYDYYNPEARISLAPTRFVVKEENGFADQAINRVR